MRSGIGFLLFVLGCSSNPPSTPTTSKPATSPSAVVTRGASIAETVLREYQSESRCPEVDDQKKGGIRTLWCHLPAARASLAVLRDASGTAVFKSGPHKDALVLDATSEFGHYDPAFVRWLDVPARGSPAQIATQAVYDAKLSPLAEIFWRTLQKIENDKACFEKERQAYADSIAKKALPRDYYERWFYFMNPWFCEKGTAAPNEFYFENAYDAQVNGHVTKSVVGFWMRRSLDGTQAAFAEGLKKLLAAYEPDLLAVAWKAPDPRSLERALEGGIKASLACKDPSAPIDKVYVAITMHADGKVDAWIKSPAVKGTRSAACIEKAFAAQSVAPFEGHSLPFTRTLPLK